MIKRHVQIFTCRGMKLLPTGLTTLPAITGAQCSHAIAARDVYTTAPTPFITVAGAGVAQANGIYVPDGVYVDSRYSANRSGKTKWRNAATGCELVWVDSAYTRTVSVARVLSNTAAFTCPTGVGCWAIRCDGGLSVRYMAASAADAPPTCTGSPVGPTECDPWFRGMGLENGAVPTVRITTAPACGPWATQYGSGVC